MSYPENFQFRKEFEINSFMVSPNGTLRVKSLADLLQEIAWKHADSEDFGRNLMESQQMWALSRFEFKIFKLPKWGDEIEVFTGGRGVEKFFAFREFLIRDKSGNILVRAMSSWLLLDLRTKRIQRPDQVLPAQVFDPQLKPDWQPHKILVEGEEIFSCSLQVKHSDLDLYNHVNNTSYIRWVEDCCLELGMQIIEELSINYQSECKLGDQLNLMVYEFSGEFLLKAVLENKVCFTAKCKGKRK